MDCCGIVLCGGKSSRMGHPKAWLPFGPELMLPRVVRLLKEVVQPIVVVAAPDQDLPSLPSEVSVVRDRREGRGPLEGLAGGLAGLRAIPNGREIEAAYVTSCDVPLLRPEFVRRMIELLGDNDIAVPYIGGYHHPLAAVYRTGILPSVERLLEENRLRPVFLFEQVRTRFVSEAELGDIDPELQSLRNLNYPEDYLTALKIAGHEAPAEVLAKLQAAGPRQAGG